MSSPFPGMDPYLEHPERWPDVHLSLIYELRTTLIEWLRPRYVVRAEERVYVVEEEGDDERAIRPDLTVGPREGAPGTPEVSATGPASAPVIVPTLLPEERRERCLVIRRPRDERSVVTVIEVLSPSNKTSPSSSGRRAYLQKRREVLESSSHLVELDLLRAGARIPMARALPRAAYYAIVGRADRRPACEVYPVGLRDRLPEVRVPLQGEEEVALDLQAVLDRVHERGGYADDTDYDAAPVPPLDEGDAAWARRRVAAWRAGGG